MTTKNFSVKNGLTAGNITLDATSGNIEGGNAILTGDLSVTGISDLGAIGNVRITGGSNGQSIITDGAGNLSFANITAASNPAPMPIVIDSGNTLTISANYQGLFGYPLTIDGILDVEGILIDVNDNGNGGGGGTATALNANIANVSISGGSSGYYLQTDGAGTLSWAAGGGGGGGSPGGVTTQVQFNDAGSFAGNTGFTFNKTTGIFTAPYLSGNGNGLSNIQGANVSGAVGLATYAGTANSVAGANVSGAVTYATTANSVALANVSGAGNITSINLDGSSSNVLYGNGVFAPAAGGGSYGNSNVATFLASYGSNTITTTGNVSVGNIIGNGQALTGIAGANVSGAVSYATTANSVAVANISGIGVAFSLFPFCISAIWFLQLSKKDFSSTKAYQQVLS